MYLPFLFIGLLLLLCFINVFRVFSLPLIVNCCWVSFGSIFPLLAISGCCSCNTPAFQCAPFFWLFRLLTVLWFKSVLLLQIIWSWFSEAASREQLADAVAMDTFSLSKESLFLMLLEVSISLIFPGSLFKEVSVCRLFMERFFFPCLNPWFVSLNKESQPLQLCNF